MFVSSTIKRLAASGVLVVVLLLFLALHMDWFYVQGSFQEPLLSKAVLFVILICYLLTLQIRLTPLANHFWILASFVLLPCAMVLVIESLAGQNGLQLPTNVFWLNVFWCQVIYLLFFAFTNHYRFSIVAGTIFCYVFGAGNYFVLQFRGNPLLPADLTALGTAADVAASYVIAPDAQLVIAALAAFFALMLALVPQFHERRRNWKQIGASLLLLTVICFLIGNFYENKTWYQQKISVNFWNQPKGYQDHGAALSFAMNVRYLFPKPPNHYSAASASRILQNAQEAIQAEPNTRQEIKTEQEKEAVAVARENPNIIVIMNESFADLSVLGDLQTSIPYLEFYDSLQENTIKGNLLVSVLGGGTCNTEFEMLTGNTSGFLPYGVMAYQMYVKRPLDSLATILRSQGYRAVAFHPGKPDSWERDRVYPLLGFEEFLTVHDVEQPEYMRGVYVSDSCDYDQVISLYENKGDDKLFLFNVTIQNHGGYQLGTDDIAEWVSITKPAGETYAQAEQFLSLMRASDQALEKLITYFAQQPEPTLVLFFGDHQPNLEPALIDRLLGKELKELSVKEMQKRYTVPFFLWANYDIEERTIEAISANYLSGLLLETAGLEMPLYHQYLNRLSQELPVVTGIAYQGQDGAPLSLSTRSEWSKLLQEYEIVQYNHFFDKQNRIAEAYTILNNQEE